MDRWNNSSLKSDSEKYHFNEISFASTTPIFRRGRYDVFGMDEDDAPQMSSLHTPRHERKSILLSRKSMLPYSDLSRVNSRYQSEILNGTREDPIEAALRELDAKHQSRVKQELEHQKEQETRADSRSAKNRRKLKKHSSYDIKLSVNDGMMKSEQERKEKLAHEIQRKKDRRNEFHQRKPSSQSSRRAAILTKKAAPTTSEPNEMDQLQDIEFDGFVESYLRASLSHDENDDDEVLDLTSLNTDEQTNIQNMEKLREDLKLVYNQYFGDTAILEFQAKFKQCSVLLERYPNDQDLPQELQTPRSLYLREVAKSKLLPLPLVLRSDKDPLAINLSHRGLGDKRILPIIKVMEKLPSVHTVDLSDNRLTDITLMPLATKLINLPNLTYLDLSYNKMDDSSETIMDYLKSKDCKLKTLKLDGADVDDHECVNLALAITQNTSLRTLSLSHNLIGKSELLNVVHPDLTTGGEALGDMLKINKTLTKLDLSWNSIRLDSAIALALSLEVNHTLRTLLLGYNSFGDMPCQILGTVLKSNKGLTELDIESNSLTPKAATVLANAISFNETLLKLNINGNTLGKIGAQALVAAIQRSSTEDRKLQVSFVNCDCNIDDNNIFSAANPHGTWRMNLKEPYGQMVASECLYLANHKAGCRIVRLYHNGQLVTLERSYVATAEEGEAGLQKKFKLDEFYKNSKSAAIELLANNFEEASKYLNNLLVQFGFFMDEEQRLTVIKKTSELWKIKAKREGRDDLHEVFLYEIFFSLFVLNDADLSGTMELDEFLTTLDSLGKKDFDREAAKRLMGEYDRDESGSIDANEFGTIMLTEFCRTEIPRGELVDVSTGKPWEIPISGTCVIQLSYQCDVPTLFDIGADHGIDNIIESIREAKTDDQREILFQNTTSSPYFFLSFDQAQLLFEEMQGLNRMPLELMASILPQIVNEEQAIKFIETNLNDIGKFALRLKIGHMYGAFVGLPTGHYYIDFKLPYQKNGARRLGAISVTEGKLCRQSGCVSSQKGNYSNFRNEKLGGIPVDVNARWFTSASNSGNTTGKILHCDYVSTQKPRKNTPPMSGQRFDKLIEQLKLDEIKRVWDRIQLVESRYFDRLSNTQNGQVGSFINPGHPDYHGLTDIENPRQSISSIIRKARASIEKESQPTVIAPPISHMRDAVVGMSPLQTNSGCPIDFHSFPELIMESPYTYNVVKESYNEYIETSHHYYDIYPEERMRDVSRPGYNPNERPPTPEDMKLGPAPSRANVSPIYPLAYRRVLELEIIMPHLYICVGQLLELLKYFPPDEGFLRIQLIQAVFSHITDIENMYIIIDTVLTFNEQNEIFHRIGILNLLDPMKPDRLYRLDLRRYDHREWVKILAALAIAEPGDNWEGVEYRWGKYDEHVPGWTLPASWCHHDDGGNTGGPRTHGWLKLFYRSTGNGCMPVWSIRKYLRKRTLAGLKRLI